MTLSDKSASIALIGAGYWGKNLFRVLNELKVLSALCETDNDVLSKYKREYPDIECCSSLKALLGSKAISAVVIAAPAAKHYELTKMALEQGKDVYVEKPLALKALEGRELVELARRSKKVLMVGHILQYHPAVKKLKELIQDGQIGKIQYIYSNRLNIGKLRTEEDILLSFAPHDISVILSLVGEEPLDISASGGDYLNRGIYDTTLTSMSFKEGIRSHVFVSWLHPFKEQKLVIVGSRAMAVFDDLAADKLKIYRHTIEWANGKEPIAHKADFEKVALEEGEPLKLELTHFLERLKDRKPPLTDGSEGLRVLKVIESAHRSLHEHEKEV
ncbi:MAG: Gfo/Idh/MocA family oxidoreductase [Candidatus Margulisiibacteriota bacterium]